MRTFLLIYLAHVVERSVSEISRSTSKVILDYKYSRALLYQTLLRPDRGLNTKKSNNQGSKNTPYKNSTTLIQVEKPPYKTNTAIKYVLRVP